MFLLVVQAVEQSRAGLETQAAATEARREAAVRNGADLVASLADQGITQIIITQDIQLLDADWSLYQPPMQIARNLTIRSSPQVAQPCALDFNFVANKVQLEAGVVMRLRGLVSVNYRKDPSRLAQGADIFLPSGPALPGQQRPLVIFEDGATVADTCLEPTLEAINLMMQARPPELPGVNAFRQEQSPRDCSPSPPGTPYLERCWVMKQLTVDFANTAQYVDSQGMVRDAAYMFQIFNSTLLCEAYISNACVQQNGFTACWIQARAAAGLMAPPSNSSGSSEGGVKGGAVAEPPGRQQAQERQDTGSSGEGDAGVRVVLPVVLGAVGGCLVIACVFAVVLWRRRSLRGKANRGSCGDPAFVVEVGCAARSSKGDGAATDQAVATGALSNSFREGTSTETGSSPRPAAPQPHDSSMTALFVTASSRLPGQPTTSDEGAPAVAAGGAGAGAAAAAASKQAVPAAQATAAIGSVSVVLTPQTPLAPGVRMDLCWGVDVVAHHDAVRGAGSFGRVTEGTYLGLRCAIKALHTSAARNQASAAKCAVCLVQEADVLSKCSHPNVVALYGACLQPPHMCLVMELMDQSLDQLMEGHTKLLPMEQVLKVASDMAAGLAYLHPTVVHRDLKPANVLLDASGTAKLGDFGLARLRYTVLETRHPEAGTAPYTAPECFDPENLKVSHKADIYSWAVVVWEMLSGQRPWAGQAALAIALAVTLQGKRLPLGSLPRDRCPGRLQQLLVECWDEDPQRRPSAAELVKRLALVQQQLQVQVRGHHSSVVPAANHDANAAPDEHGGSGSEVNLTGITVDIVG